MCYKSMVVVANTGDGSISVIDPFSMEELRRIKLSENAGPYDLIGFNGSSRVLVSQYFADSLACIDLLNGQVVNSVTIGRRPCHIVYDRVKDLVFVTNSDSDTISIVRGSSMKLIGQIGVGSMPLGIDFHPIARSMVVANVNSNDVMILEGDDLSLRKVVKLDQNPFHTRFSSDGKTLYISCSLSQDGDIGSILVIDMESYEVTEEIGLKGMPGQLYSTEDDKYLLIASMGQGGLEIVDINKRRTLKKVSTNGMTQGIAMDTEEKYVYVTNPDDDSITAVDWKLGRKTATIKVGKEPNGILYI